MSFALVTGASRGIGLATVRELARAGHDVAFTARTVEPGTGTVPARTVGEGAVTFEVPGSLQETVAEVEALGVRGLPAPMDLADLRSVEDAADTVLRQWGAPGVVVANAVRHVPHARFLELTVDDLRASLEANFVAQVVLLQRLLPAMAESGGGLVVVVCSGSTFRDPPRPPGEGGWGLGYAASKAAAGRIAGAINAEWRSAGVRAYNVEPGFVVTESGAARGGTGAIEAQGFAGAPVEATGQVVAWLASLDPEGSEATGLLGRMINAPEVAGRLKGR